MTDSTLSPQLMRFIEGRWEAATVDETWSFYQHVQAELMDIGSVIDPSARISRRAEIVGPVIVGAEAVIMPNAYVRGPAVLGRGAILGQGAMVRPGTVMGNDAMLGNLCYANAALMAAASRLGHFCGVSRSVMYSGAYFTAFVMTATTRADYRATGVGNSEKAEKRGSVIGALTTIAPHVTIPRGTSIGRECFVGSYVRLIGDLPPKTRITAEIPLKVEPNTIVTAPRRPSKLPEFPTK